MIYLRALAGLLLLIAVFAIVADVTRSLAAHNLVLTPLLAHWERLSPTSLKNFEGLVSRTAGPVVWTLGVKRVLQVPAALLFLSLGLLASFLGRRRRRVDIYSN
jgi:hypothetical protein